jgi:serine/threonine protein kinase
VSKVVKKGERMTEQCGTPAYIAPEILKGKGYEGYAIDIWSAGVVLFAMIYGTVPFKASAMSDLHKQIIKGKYTLKTDVSEDVRDLLRRMLETDPRRRISIPQILCHPWFSEYDENSIRWFLL